MNTSRFIGVVADGRVDVVASDARLTTASCRLTADQETGDAPRPLSLVQYEGMAVLVRGVALQEGWIHAASVVESGGELLTAVLLKAFEGRDGVQEIPGAL